jgi:hypothetical protein
MAELFNRTFGLEGEKKVTPKNLKRLAGRYKIRNGMRGPDEGLSHPVGTERENRGYRLVKTASGKWASKQSLIWEAANGPIPKGSRVIFADGNKSNLSLDNLMMVTQAELGYMNHAGIIGCGKEIMESAKLIADIKMAMTKRFGKNAIRQMKRAAGIKNP